MVSNFSMAGKLGDFLHAMFAVKHISQHKNTKANVYMYDIGWEFGINNTHAELKPILEQQDYINELHISDGPLKKSIDLGGYINSPWLYQSCWSDIYSRTFNFPITGDYKWISWNKLNPELQGKVLIQRKANDMRNNQFPYRDIIDHYGRENVVFISSSENDYNQFPFNNEIEFYKVTTLDEWFTTINSAGLVIANLSAPAVMASALDKPRIIELPDRGDRAHYIGEEKYSKNAYWFLTSQIHNI
jgi:ADP-heptose:LPS heptosyltransferase